MIKNVLYVGQYTNGTTSRMRGVGYQRNPVPKDFRCYRHPLTFF